NCPGVVADKRVEIIQQFAFCLERRLSKHRMPDLVPDLARGVPVKRRRHFRTFKEHTRGDLCRGHFVHADPHHPPESSGTFAAHCCPLVVEYGREARVASRDTWESESPVGERVRRPRSHKISPEDSTGEGEPVAEMSAPGQGVGRLTS